MPILGLARRFGHRILDGLCIPPENGAESYDTMEHAAWDDDKVKGPFTAARCMERV